MATADVPWDWLAFRIEAYYYIVKVTKFELNTAYRFSTAEGRTILWAAPGLFRVKLDPLEVKHSYILMIDFINFKLCLINPSCTKLICTHTFYEGMVEKAPYPPPLIILKTANFNFGRSLGLSMRGKKN